MTAKIEHVTSTTKQCPVCKMEIPLGIWNNVPKMHKCQNCNQAPYAAFKFRTNRNKNYWKTNNGS